MSPVRFLEILSSGLKDVPDPALVSSYICDWQIAGTNLYSMQVLSTLGSHQREIWGHSPWFGIAGPFRNGPERIP